MEGKNGGLSKANAPLFYFVFLSAISFLSLNLDKGAWPRMILKQQVPSYLIVLYLEQAKCVCSDGFQPTVKASHLETADSPFSKLPSNRSSSGDGSSLSSKKILFCVIMFVSASSDSIFFHNPQCLLGWSVDSGKSKQ